MINIQDSRVFEYSDGTGFVTVYPDMDKAKNLWYIVPEPAYATNESGEPMFNLTEYTSESGEQKGTCSFIVDLRIPKRALDLAKEHLPGAEFGQLQWLSSTAYFKYNIEGEPYIAAASPSMVASNRAAFVVELPNQAAIETFRNAFGPGRATSGFTLEYDVTTLASFPAVDVEVSYSSQIAYEYSKKVDINRNVWGKETSRKETIKKEFKNSDAGDVKIKWSIPDPSEELQQRVDLWAWTTLEGLVDKAVADAVAQIGEGNADKFELSATFDFGRSYSENEVIEWVIAPTLDLPSFSAADWDKHFKKEDHQRFDVAFTLLDALGDAEYPQRAVDSVKVEVKYPTLTAGNSHTFEKGDTDTTWEVNADGYLVDGKFDPNYEFRYIVVFKERGRTYTSPWIGSTSSEQLINTGELGVQRAVFEAVNVDFKNTTDYILVNVAWDTAESADSLNQEKIITGEKRKVHFFSNTYTRSTNSLTYQLLFVQKDGNRIAVAPRHLLGPENRRRVFINNPFQPAQFNVQVLNPAGQGVPKIDYVSLTATYDDFTNGVTGLSHQWSYPEGEPSKVPFFPVKPSFQVDVIENPNGSYVEYNGFLVLNDGNVQEVRNLRNQTKQMLLMPGKEYFGVLFKGNRIDWEAVDEVTVNTFRMAPSQPLTLSYLGPQASTKLLASEDKIDPGDFRFMKGLEDADGKPFQTPDQIYSFQRDANKVATYYYTAKYHMKDGTLTYAKGEDVHEGIVTLPPKGTSATPVVHRGVLIAR